MTRNPRRRVVRRFVVLSARLTESLAPRRRSPLSAKPCPRMEVTVYHSVLLLKILNEPALRFWLPGTACSRFQSWPVASPVADRAVPGGSTTRRDVRLSKFPIDAEPQHSASGNPAARRTSRARPRGGGFSGAGAVSTAGWTSSIPPAARRDGPVDVGPGEARARPSSTSRVETVTYLCRAVQPGDSAGTRACWRRATCNG